MKYILLFQYFKPNLKWQLPSSIWKQTRAKLYLKCFTKSGGNVFYYVNSAVRWYCHLAEKRYPISLKPKQSQYPIVKCPLLSKIAGNQLDKDPKLWPPKKLPILKHELLYILLLNIICYYCFWKWIRYNRTDVAPQKVFFLNQG